MLGGASSFLLAAMMVTSYYYSMIRVVLCIDSASYDVASNADCCHCVDDFFR